LPRALATLPDLRPENAAARRRVTMAMFFMNGRPFDPRRIDGRGRLGDLELWQVENVGTMDHPFHLHTWYFQVIARNGQPEPFRAWRDTVNLKPGDRLDLMVPLVDYPGRTVYHCHIAEHGDKGMMAVLEVAG
jgi:FtsP/CotA-like multicopper oxidase with cupredoxin domain